MTVTNGTYATVAGLNNITAFGVFVDLASRIDVEGFKVVAGQMETALQLWTDNYGIYNDDAAGTNDYDLDGLNNVSEWGLGGDPTDGNDTGNKPVGLGVVGADFVYLYPRLKTDARPQYSVEEDGNLLYPPLFSNQEASYTITVGGDWPGASEFVTITNAIPTDLDAKFIQLMIAE